MSDGIHSNAVQSQRRTPGRVAGPHTRAHTGAVIKSSRFHSALTSRIILELKKRHTPVLNRKILGNFIPVARFVPNRGRMEKSGELVGDSGEIHEQTIHPLLRRIDATSFPPECF